MMAKDLLSTGTGTGTQEIMMAKRFLSAGTSRPEPRKS